MNQPVIIQALQPVVRAMKSLGVGYYIGGSIASSFHGTGRTTVDIDLVAEIRVEHVPRLVELLDSEYYIESDMIRDAIRSGRSFNVIHLPTSYKVDIFISGARAFDRSARSRFVQAKLPGDERHDYSIASAEDTILSKLEWFRLGGEISERQWGDVVGVMRVQADALDQGYLDRWAAELGVSDLLNRARQEAVI